MTAVVLIIVLGILCEPEKPNKSKNEFSTDNPYFDIVAMAMLQKNNQNFLRLYTYPKEIQEELRKAADIKITLGIPIKGNKATEIINYNFLIDVLRKFPYQENETITMNFLQNELLQIESDSFVYYLLPKDKKSIDLVEKAVKC